MNILAHFEPVIQCHSGPIPPLLRQYTVDRFGAYLAHNSFMQTVLQQLEGCCFYETDIFRAQFYNQLLSTTSHKLRSLHVDSPIVAPPNGFGKLKELCIYQANYSKINCIMQSVKRLERVFLEFVANRAHSNTADEVKLENQLVKLWSEPSLESISIKMDRDIPVIWRALMRTELVQRGKLRFKMYIKEQIGNARDYLELINQKVKYCARHFVFKFRCVITQDMMGTVNTHGGQVGEVLRTTRTNSDVNLNGYQEEWLYPCVCNH